MTLNPLKNGTTHWPRLEENGVTIPRKYSEFSATDAIQADCDVKATNIILQGLPPEVYALVSNHRIAKNFGKEFNLFTSRNFIDKTKEVGDKFLSLGVPLGPTLYGASGSNSNETKELVAGQAQANGQILHKEELAFLADPGTAEDQAKQTVITHNATY
ncbi:hypothetical protein Tco_0513306 [Tanacetum coccineum]